MSRSRSFGCARLAVAALLLASLPAAARAQNTQPVWYPPHTLYGRPVARPFFDFPNWARYSYCRPAPLAWGYDPFPDYGPQDCACDGPESINCPGDFVAHRPSSWYGTVDFAPLTVDYTENIEIARVSPGNATALTTSAIQPEFDAGGKYTVGRRVFDCYRIEGTYWGEYTWDDGAVAARSTNSLTTLLSNGFTGTASDDLNSLVALDARTQMHSAELNVWYWIDMPPGGLDVSLMAGGRYLNIDDRFSVFSRDLAGTDVNDLNVRTGNDLWFLQIGLATDWLVHPRFWVHFDIKGGVGMNDISLASEYAATSPTTFGATTTNFQERTSWLGDLSLVGNFQVTPWLVARIGYQALFVEGLAVAQENIQIDTALRSDPAIPAALNDSGRLIFHGPLIGLTGMW